MKKMYFIPAMMLIALAACNKNTDVVTDESRPESRQESAVGVPVTFSTEAMNSGTKATLDGVTLKWAAADKIAVYSYKGSAAAPQAKDLCVLDSGAGATSATFAPVNNNLSGDWIDVAGGSAGDTYTFYSWYPANGYSLTGSSETLTHLSASQTLSAGVGSYLICWAQGNETKTHANVAAGYMPSFSYTPKVALVKVKLHNASGVSVSIRKIIVTADNDAKIAGNVSLNVKTGALGTGSASKIEFDLGENVAIADGADSPEYTIVVLPVNETLYFNAVDASGDIVPLGNVLVNPQAAYSYTRTQNIQPLAPVDGDMETAKLYYGEANCLVMSGTATDEQTLDISLRKEGDNHARGDVATDYRSAVKGVKVIWAESALEDDLEPSLSWMGNECTLTVNKTSSDAGNALIGIYDNASCTGNPIWSFHVWAPDNEQYGDQTSGSYTAQKLALGQITGATDTYMYYQWGRKDPLGRATDISHSTLKSVSPTSLLISDGPATTIDDARTNPTKFYKNTSSPCDWHSSSQDNNLWSESSSTIYDPCPKNYHVAPQALWSGVTTSNWGKQTGPLRIEYGSLTYVSGGLRFYDDGSVNFVGSDGYYWSGAVSGTNGVILYFHSDNVNPARTSLRAYGYGVRCVQN